MSEKTEQELFDGLKSEQELEAYQCIVSTVKARRPVSMIISWEESRVKEAMIEIARSRKTELFFWDCANGLYQEYPKSSNKITDPSDYVDPISAIEFIDSIQYSQEQEGGIFVMNDFHKFWGSSGQGNYEDPGAIAIIRRIKNFANSLQRKCLFIVSSDQKIPTDLNKVVQIIDFPLPDKNLLSNIIDNLLESVKNRKKQGKLENKDIQDEIDPVEKETILNGSLGLTECEFKAVLAYQIVRNNRLSVEKIIAAKEEQIRKSGLVEFVKMEGGVEQIGGLDEMKDWLTLRKQAFSDRAREYGLPNPKGVLLVGIQGCGKSLTAKAASALYQMPLLRFDVGRVFGGIVGQSEANMREVQRIVEAVAPCVLWIDEIEKGMAGTKSSDRSDAGTAARVFGSFLTWMNEKTQPVFVVATANNISGLPPELLRKGRFDEIFFVDLPNKEERMSIFDIHIQKRKRDPKVYDIAALAESSLGHTGAEIEQAIIEGMFKAFSEEREFNTDDIMVALNATIPLSKTMKEDIETLREWAKKRARYATSGSNETRRDDEDEDKGRSIGDDLDFNDAPEKSGEEEIVDGLMTQ